MTEKALKPIKPFLNYEEQINNLIEQKGMIVNDHKFAVSKLEDISYFALIDGYKNLFYNPMTRKYKEGTTFEDLVALYEFDEKLRTLILRYLCHFEQKMRSLISYHFCDTYSEKQEDYLNAVHYNNSGANKKKIAALIAILDREAKKSTDHASLSKKNIWKCSYVGHYENFNIWTDVKDVFISDDQYENEN